MRRIVWAVAASLLVAPWSARAAESVPVELTIQGRLLDSQDQPVQGNTSFVVAVYDLAADAPGAAATPPLWTAHFDAVPVTDGVFSLVLGEASSNQPLDATVFSSGPRWLGVAVNGGAELTPRLPVSTVPFAMTASHALEADGLSAGTYSNALALTNPANALAGDGSLLTNLDAAQLATGTIADARLGANVPRFDATSTQTFAGPIAASAFSGDGSGLTNVNATTATHADSADLATTATHADSADLATTATSADSASRAQTADTASTALGLSCSGCVTSAMIDPSVTADFAKSQSLARVATSGAYADLAGLPDLGRFGLLASPNDWAAGQSFGGDLNFNGHEALMFRFQTSATDPVACGPDTVGLAYFSTTKQALLVCNGSDFFAVGGAAKGTRANPAKSCQEILDNFNSKGSGLYWLTEGADTFQAWCDMETDGGGWTLAMNLDTSDGHVMWWANSLWTDASTYGNPGLTGGDYKSPAWMDYAGATKVMIVVHENGSVVGWKSFRKVDGATLHDVMQGGDNTLLGTSVIHSSVGGIASNERLVRLSTALYANHCVQTGGSCTSGNSGSPDGDRLSSNEAAPSDNNEGGLGNWSDMRACCGGQTIAGKTCTGAAFRTTSEAQGGWTSACGYNQGGTFGTDSFGAMNSTCNDSTCSGANWAQPSGIAYDFAVYLGG